MKLIPFYLDMQIIITFEFIYKRADDVICTHAERWSTSLTSWDTVVIAGRTK